MLNELVNERENREFEAHLKTCEEKIFEVYRFAVSNGCICRFPRLVYLLTTNPNKLGVGANLLINATQKLMFAALGNREDLKPTIRFDKASNEYKCNQCNSRYKVDLVGHGMHEILYVKALEIKAPQLGADVVKPVPLIHTVFHSSYYNIHPKFDLIYRYVNDDLQQFVDYYTELRKDELVH